MPDPVKSFDDLYKGVAQNYQGLTPDKFREDMSNPDNRYRLWKNLTENKEKGIPSDYSQFTNTYGFNKPQAPKQGEQQPQPHPSDKSPYDPQNPEYVRQQTEKQLSDEAEKTKKISDSFLMGVKVNGENPFKLNPDGTVGKVDPHADPHDILDKAASQAGQKILEDNNESGTAYLATPYGKDHSYVDAYYNEKDPFAKQQWLKKIQESNPDFKPFTDAQWKTLQDAKIPMYQHYLLAKTDAEVNKDKNAEALSSTLGAAIGPLGGAIAAHAMKDADAKAIDDDYLTYNKAIYGGQSAIPTDKADHFWSGLYSALPSFVQSGQTKVDYNRNLANVLNQNGITAQTKEQAKEFNPTTGDVVAELAGTTVPFILQATAANYVGEALNLNKIGNTLLNSDNTLTRLTGKFVNNLFANNTTMLASDITHPIQAMMQGTVFSGVEALSSGIGVKATSVAGRAIMKYMQNTLVKGAVATGVRASSGVATGVVTGEINGLMEVVKNHILNSAELPQEAGKENPSDWALLNPTTKEAIANDVMMGLMGGVHGSFNYDEVYKDLISHKMPKMAEALKEHHEEAVANNDKVQATQEAIKSGSPKKAGFPVKEDHAEKTENAIKIPREDKDNTHLTALKNSKATSADSHVVVKETSNNDDGNADGRKFRMKALSDGHIIREIPVMEEGKQTGTRTIAVDKNYPELADHMVKLVKRELDGSATPDEIHELGTLEGNDPVKFADKMAKAYPEHADDFNRIKTEVEGKTGDNYGGYNEIASINKEIEAAKKGGDQTKDLELQAELTARKYGFKTHKENGDLKVTDEKGEVIGTDNDRVSYKNKNEIDDVFNDETPIDELNQVAEKSNLKAIEIPDDKGEMKRELVDDQGKTIKSTKPKTLEDFKENPTVGKLIENIGRLYSKGIVPDIHLKDSKGIEITPQELKEAYGNALHGTPTPNAERILEALNDVETKGIDVGDGHIDNAEEFLKLPDEAKGTKGSKSRGVPMKAKTKEYTNTNALEKEWKKPEGMYKDMSDEELQKELSKKGLPDKDKSMIENIQKSRKTEAEKNASSEKEAQKKSKQDKVNALTEKVKDYNSKTDRQRKTAEGQKQKSDIETSAKELGFTPEQKGTALEIRNDKGNIVRPKTEGLRSEAEGSKPLKERSDDVQFLFQKLEEKGVISFPRIESQGKLMNIGDVEKAIQDIKEGKTTNAANDVLNTLEDNIKSGDVTVGTEGNAGTGKTSVPIEDYLRMLDEPDVHAAGFFTKNAKKLSSKTPVESLNRPHQIWAKSDIDLRNTYSEVFNKFMGDPDGLKAELNKRAVEFYGAGEEAKDNPSAQAQYHLTAERLSAISDAIGRKEQGGLRDMRNMLEVLTGRKTFYLGDKELKANTLEEARALEELKKPKLPITAEEIKKMEKAISLEDPEYTAFINDFGNDEKGKVREALDSLVNAFRFTQDLYKILPPEIQGKGNDLIRKVFRKFIKDRSENINHFHSLLNDKNFDQYHSVEKQNVADAFAKGWYVNGKYYSDEELRTGQSPTHLDIPKLTETEIGLYKKVRDIIKTAQEHYREQGREQHGYYTNMNPEQRAKHDAKYRSYLDENNGYVPFQRHGDYYVLYHGLNKITGQEERHVEMHQDEKAANDRAKQLSEQTYQVDGKTKKNVGISEDNQRAEGTSPLVKKIDKLPKNLIEDISHGDIATLEHLQGKQVKGSDMYNELGKAIDKIKAEKYNPAFIPSKKVLGADTGFENMMESIKGWGERGINSLSKSAAASAYDANSKFMNPSRYRNGKKAFDNWMKDLKDGTTTQGWGARMQNLQYKALLSARPSFYAQQWGHVASTVVPYAKHLMRGIDIERKAQAEKTGGKYKSTGLAEASFAKAAPKALALTTKLVASSGDKVFTGKDFGGNESDARIINRLVNRGTIGHTFYNDIMGRDYSGHFGLSGASTGYADLHTRMYAGLIGLDIGKMEGITDEKKLMEYTEDFVDKTKFVYGKANRPPIMRDITTGAQPLTDAVTWGVRQLMTMRSSHIMDDFFNVEMVKEAQKQGTLTKTIADLAAPRLILGGIKSIAPMAGLVGGYALWAYNEARGKESIKNAANLQEQGARLDAAIRDAFLKIPFLNKEHANIAADYAINGAGRAANIDLRSTVDLGSVLREGMPLADQLMGSGFSAAKSIREGKLPGELGNLAKAWTWYGIMENKAHNEYGKKEDYQGGGVEITPTKWDIGAKMAGFNTISNEKYYDYESMKQAYVGTNGKGIEPEAGSFKDNILNKIGDATINDFKEKHEDIDNYLAHPSEDTFKKAFGATLTKDINEYNIGLHDNVYSLYQSLDVPQKEKEQLLAEFSKWGIGMTWEDAQWDISPNTDYGQMVGVQRKIYDAINYNHLRPQPVK